MWTGSLPPAGSTTPRCISAGSTRAHSAQHRPTVFLPELAQVPDRYLAEPALMPAAEQQRAGCRIGVDYPAPIVDHRVARLDALARYRAAIPA